MKVGDLIHCHRFGPAIVVEVSNMIHVCFFDGKRGCFESFMQKYFKVVSKA